MLSSLQISTSFLLLVKKEFRLISIENNLLGIVHSIMCNSGQEFFCLWYKTMTHPKPSLGIKNVIATQTHMYMLRQPSFSLALLTPLWFSLTTLLTHQHSQYETFYSFYLKENKKDGCGYFIFHLGNISLSLSVYVYTLL